METKFEKLKAELLLKAKNNNACQSGYSQAEICETEKELLQVIADNFHWVWQTKTMTIEDLNKFGSDLLQSAGIFVNYEKNIKSDLNKLILVGTTSPTIVTYGSSSPTIVTYDSSSPTIETYDSSSPTIATNGSSSPTIVTYGSSSPTIVTYGSSSPRIAIYDSSSPTIVTNDSSSPRIVAYYSSSPTIETFNSSSPRIVAYYSSSPTIGTYDSSSPKISGIENCIISKNLSLIIDLNNKAIINSENWTVK